MTNPYETVDFSTRQNGVYKFVVLEYADRDDSQDTRLGMSVNW